MADDGNTLGTPFDTYESSDVSGIAAQSYTASSSVLRDEDGPDYQGAIINSRTQNRITDHSIEGFVTEGAGGICDEVVGTELAATPSVIYTENRGGEGTNKVTGAEYTMTAGSAAKFSCKFRTMPY